MLTKPESSLPRWLPLVVLIAAVCVLFVRLLLGETLFWGLPVLQFFPWRDFAMSEFANGRMPLWNPYSGAGAPLLANYQSALLYPPHLLYFVYAGPAMMGWIGMLHIVWAGLGMWALTGRFGLSAFGRGLAALCYPLSSTSIARFGTFPMVEAAAWLPWLLFAVDGLITQATLRRWLLLAIIAAMQLLVGHAQWTFYSWLLVGAYGLWRVIHERRTALILVICSTAIGFAILLTAAQLFPTAELQRLSQRADSVTESFAFNFSYSPVSLITLFNPDFFGNPGDGSYVIGGAYFETAAYIGVLPIVLTVVTLLRFRKVLASAAPARRARLIFFALVAVITLILAFGNQTPIYPMLYRYVPTFNLFQAPARWLLLTVFSLTMIAAETISTWETTYRGKRNLRLMMACGIGLALLGLLLSVIMPDATPIMRQMARGIAVLGVLLGLTAELLMSQPPKDSPRRLQWQLVALIFVAADLVWANRVSNPSIYPSFYRETCEYPAVQGRLYWDSEDEQTKVGQVLPFKDYPFTVANANAFRCSMLPNLNVLDRYHYFNNFDPLRPAWVETVSGMLNESAAIRQAAQVQAQASLIPENPLLTAMHVDEGDFPRAWIAPRAVIATNTEDARAKMLAADWNPRTTVILMDQADLSALPTAGETATVTIADESPQYLVMQTDYPTAGVLYVADTYYPGWEAAIDGQPAPILRANIGFRAVILPAGKHTVEMTYMPSSFRLGVIVSLAALAVFAMLVIIAVIRKQPDRR